MNGPQHFSTAEQLVKRSEQVPMDDGHAQLLVAQAQVHATLAQAAATIDAGNTETFPPVDDVTSTEVVSTQAWEEVTA